MLSRQEFRFWRVFIRYLSDSVCYYGVTRTLHEVSIGFLRVLRNRAQALRQVDSVDLGFDLEHTVDTTRSNVSLQIQMMAALVSHEYCPSEPLLFKRIIDALPIQFTGYTFIDLGSGKGRSLLMAAAYPFRRILGVEFLPELHRIAERNITQHFANRRQQCQVESICQDAREFSFPPDPSVLYLFNPFPEPVFAAVLTNVRRSLIDNPRPLFVAYLDPEHEHLLENCTWLKKVSGTQEWGVYKA
jgi:hypothetical protein